jgi:hypothetical protein
MGVFNSRNLTLDGRVICCGRRVSTGVGVGVATFTPLFHTSLEPDLMQVYLNPDEVLVELSLVQADPGFTAAFEGAMNCIRNIDRHNIPTRRRFMAKL